MCNLFVWLKDTSEIIDGELYKKSLQGTYWDFTGETKNLTKEGNIEFPNGKKPIKLISRIMELFPEKNITVLDFFAGSGSTGHAVISLNNSDGGKRKFILCTNNESNICEEITYVRLKNVIDGYKTKKGKKVLGISANLKYYRTDFIPKDAEDLRVALMKHIQEMIQLEHGVKLDGKNYIMLLDDDDADELAAHWNEYPSIKALYVADDVLFSTEQTKLFSDLEIHTIPDYYFNFELREVGEAW